MTSTVGENVHVQPRRVRPRASSVEEERAWRKQRLAAAFRVFGRFGFSEGTAGHITARDPERTDCFWVNPYGMSFSLIRVSDLILVNHDGDVVVGDQPVNRAAFAIHSAIHAARPDVEAAAHSHSLYGKAFSSLDRRIDPITHDACVFYEDHEVFADYTGVVLDVHEGRRIAAALGSAKALILRNHGLLTVGASVEEAAWWFVTMERSCQAQLVAEAAGTPIHIDHETASAARADLGKPEAGWFSFQPLYDRVLKEEPDLCD